jgi:hypothetical protein
MRWRPSRPYAQISKCQLSANKTGFLRIFPNTCVRMNFAPDRRKPLYLCGLQSILGSGLGETRTRNQRLKRALLYH